MGEVAAKLPIDQLTKAIVCLLGFVNAVDQSGRQKGVMLKAMPFMSLADEFAALEGASWSVILEQLKDMDAAERAAIKATIQTKLDLADDQLEGAIEDLIGVLNDGLGLFTKIKAILERK